MSKCGLYRFKTLGLSLFGVYILVKRWPFDVHYLLVFIIFIIVMCEYFLMSHYTLCCAIFYLPCTGYYKVQIIYISVTTLVLLNFGKYYNQNIIFAFKSFTWRRVKSMHFKCIFSPFSRVLSFPKFYYFVCIGHIKLCMCFQFLAW